MTGPAGPAVQVGLTLPSFQSDPERVLTVARAAEDAGLDGVFLFDHLFRQRGDAADAERRPALELMTMTAAVAAATDQIKVGTLVARATLRPPGTTRANFDTLARIAPGRIIAGLGAGDDDSLAEDVAFGVVPPTPDPDPSLWVAPARPSAAGGWEAAGPDVIDPAAAHQWRRDCGQYRVARLEATVDALSGQGYPVWVAGSSPAARRLAALSDGWNSWGGNPSRFAVAAGRMREDVAAAGREPARFTYTWGGLAVLAPTPVEAHAKWDRLGGGRSGIIHGTPPEVADQIAAYAAVGADWVILGPIDSSNPDNAALLGAAINLLDRPHP
jgi:alkanesulfonate monooxygenase SsuD/methylene tetrahydromethanopterin reductase-like flavin-dependent oxidoreductase (luciferase family)